MLEQRKVTNVMGKQVLVRTAMIKANIEPEPFLTLKDFGYGLVCLVIIALLVINAAILA